MSYFKIPYQNLLIPTVENPWVAPHKEFKKNFRNDELIELFPDRPIDVVDIGCGYNKFKARDIDSVIGLDHVVTSDMDKKLDITKKLPFDNNSIDFVYASHFIEHLDINERELVFNEVLRILRPGGIFFIKVPHYSHYLSYGYDHKTYYGVSSVFSIANSFWYSKIPNFHVLGIGLNVRISKNNYLTRTINKLINKSFRLSESYLKLFFGGFEEIQYLLVKPV